MNIKELFGKKNMQIFFNDEINQENFIFDILVLVLMTLSCVIFIFETSEIFNQYKIYILFTDLILNIYFSIEFFLRIIYSTNKKKHFTSIYTYIDLFAILPFWSSLIKISYFKTFDIFRIFRILRFLRYLKKYLSTKNIHEKNALEKIFIIRVVFTLVFFLYASSALIYEFESPYNTNINSFFDALYFVTIAVTTVGFGDIVAKTLIGKIIIMVTIFAGLIIVPWYLGTLVKSLSLSNKKTEQKLKEQISSSEDKIIYNVKYCPHCGKRIR